MSVPHLTGTPPFRRFTRRRLLATTGLGAAGALLAACAGAATPTPPPAPKPAAPAAPAQTPTTAPKPAAPAAPAPTATTAPAAAPAKPTAVPAAQARPSAEKIQLRFLQSSVGDDDANFIRKAFADYGKDHPNVSVEYEMIPFDDYFKKIGLVLSAGTGPDMYWVTEIFAYVDAGHTRELPQEMAEDLKKDFVQIAIDNCTYKGKQ
ncbi:MAG: carbohydrate ABC transporter substrate-binding protein [Chloroflexi bacterium]|nr:carbohydrate ABC transporter substrate-binding protein [Chloroflexota bacterium]